MEQLKRGRIDVQNDVLLIQKHKPFCHALGNLCKFVIFSLKFR